MGVRMTAAKGLAAVMMMAVAMPASSAQKAGVQVGWCTGIRNVAAAKAARFDYVELNTMEYTRMSDDEFAKAVADIKQIGMPTPVSHQFIPATIRLTGPEIDRDAQMSYIRKAFDRAAALGVQTIVFGSGPARRVPDGFSKDEAFRQLTEFGKRIAVEARRRNVTVVIEPQREQETNIINTAREGLALVNAINDPNFQLMIDFFHMAVEKEDPQIVVDARQHLRHVHFAKPMGAGRAFPLTREEYDYAPFFAKLEQIGYDGRISIEATPTDVAVEGPQSVALLRRVFQRP